MRTSFSPRSASVTAITDAKTSAAGMNDRWRETHRRFGVSVAQVWIETATATHPLSSAAGRVGPRPGEPRGSGRAGESDARLCRAHRGQVTV